MEMLYWICFVGGGAFVLLSILSGLDGADLADGHFDLDTDVDTGMDPGHGSDFQDSDIELVDPGDRPRPSLFAPARRSSPLGLLTSFKFWTFGLCFFGLTGLVLSSLGVNPVGGAIAAILMGLLCGSSMAFTLRLLRRRQVNSLVQTTDLAGLEGIVEVPFDASCRGKVRLQVKGSVVDFIAYTNEAKSLDRGDRILVIGTENNRLWVTPAELPPAPPLS